MRTKMQLISGAFAILALTLVLGGEGSSQPPKPEVLMRPESLFTSLRDVIDYGVKLYNDQGDYAGCYRLFQGALITVRPYIANNQTLLKQVDNALTTADKLPRMPERALQLRTALDSVRDSFRPVLKKIEKVPNPKKIDVKPNEIKKIDEVKKPEPKKEVAKKKEEMEDVKMSSVLEFKLQPVGKAKKINEQKYSLVIRNVGKDAVRLDRRLLTPVLLLHITDSNGQKVPKLPPPVPKAFSNDEVLPLGAGKSVEIEFVIREVTSSSRVEGASLQCVYDSRHSAYPSDVHMRAGMVSSNTVKVN